jgi:hypothetical protein
MEVGVIEDPGFGGANIPPCGLEERDSGERTMGVRVNPPDIGQEKLSLWLLYPLSGRGTGLR